MIGYCSEQIKENTYAPDSIEIFNVSNFFGHIGIAMFVFEGNGVVINLNAIASNKKKYPSILKMAVLTVICWFLLLGMVGYFTYRD